MRRIDWSRYLDETGSLAIDPVVTRSTFTNSLYVAQRAKDAIVDQFRERTGARPSVRLENPDLRLNLHMNENIVSAVPRLVRRLAPPARVPHGGATSRR